MPEDYNSGVAGGGGGGGSPAEMARAPSATKFCLVTPPL